MPSLGQHIVIARAQKRWKQQQLADEAHISQKYLSQIEHDHVDPRWKILVKLAAALDPYLHLDRAAFDTQRGPQEAPGLDLSRDAGWFPWVPCLATDIADSPYAHRQVAIARQAWPAPQLVDPRTLPPTTNVAGLWWRPLPQEGAYADA